MRRPLPISAVPTSGLDHRPVSQPNDHRRAGRHRSTAGRPPRRTLVAGLALITAGVLMAGPVSAAPAGRPAVRPLTAAPMLAAATAPHTQRLVAVVTAGMQGISQHIPYVYGGGHGATPSVAAGADCSGYIRWAYYQGFGIDIGNGSADGIIRTSGNFVRVASPVPGDVALFGNGGRAPAYHAGIYVGQQNGRAAMAAEVQTGEPARIQYVWGDLMGYYRYRGVTAADLPPAGFDGFHLVSAPSASRVNAAVADPSVVAGQVSQINVAVRTAAGNAIGGAAVKVYQKSPGGSFMLGKQLTTNSGGNAAIRIVGDGSGHQFLVRYVGDSAHATSDAAILTQTGRAPVLASSGLSSRMAANSVVLTKGVTSPRYASAKVQLQHTTTSGWVSAGGASIVGKDGHFQMYWRTGSGGSYYRLVADAVPASWQASATSGNYFVRLA